MKALHFLSLLILSTCAFAQVTRTVSILPESRVYINGVSNVNKFSCEVCNDDRAELINLCYSEVQDQLVFDENRYAIKVEKFDCENRHMTSDLKETLQIDEHPYIFLQLISLDGLSLENPSNVATIKITIAGKSNEYCLPYIVKPVDQKTYRIVMENDLNMRDFSIEPPTALMGLIKVSENISIRLNLLIQLKEG